MSTIYADFGGHEFPHDLIAEIIPRFLRKQQSEVNIAEYSIEPREGAPDFDGKYFMWETYYGLGFMAPTPNGVRTVAGVGLLLGAETLTIKQIQGFRGYHEILKPFRWSRMLVQACITFAEFGGRFKDVAIKHPENIDYFHEPVDLRDGWSLEEHQHQMIGLYEGTARGMGFKFVKERELFVRAIRTG